MQPVNSLGRHNCTVLTLKLDTNMEKDSKQIISTSREVNASEIPPRFTYNRNNIPTMNSYHETHVFIARRNWSGQMPSASEERRKVQ